MDMTLEEYLRSEYGEGKIDFSFRVCQCDDRVLIYIHPDSKAGKTTPNLRVKGNLVVVDAPYPFICEGHTKNG